jgi:hypothetical protein
VRRRSAQALDLAQHFRRGAKRCAASFFIKRPTSPTIPSESPGTNSRIGAARRATTSARSSRALLPSNGVCAGQQAVRGRAERVQVRAVIDALAARLLGRHEVRRAEDLLVDARGFFALDVRRETQVGDLRLRRRGSASGSRA